MALPKMTQDSYNVLDNPHSLYYPPMSIIGLFFCLEILNIPVCTQGVQSSIMMIRQTNQHALVSS